MAKFKSFIVIIMIASLALSLSSCVEGIGKTTLSVDNEGITSIDLSWTSAKNAESYEIYRSDTQDGEYELITSISGSIFRNIGLSSSTTYYYKIRPYIMKDDEKKYGAYSGIQVGTTIDFPAPILSFLSATASSVSLSWNSVNLATGYEVYSSNAINGMYTLAYAGNATTTTITGLAPASIVWFKVKAVSGGESSEFSNANFGQTNFIINTYSVLLNPGDTTITVSWGAVSDVDGYEVHVSTNYATVSWSSNIRTTTRGTSVTVKNLKAGTKYYVTVQSYVKSGGMTYYPSFQPFIFSVNTLR
jgi:fibronectin type 3 domain-containing protein